MKKVARLTVILFGLALSLIAIYQTQSVLAAVDCAAVNIECRSGTISTNETWTSSNTYVIQGDLTIDAGVTLTIPAGTVVKLQTNVTIRVNGTLNVSGTSVNPVTFTSTADDSAGGDTNNDADATSPAAGDWESISYLAGSSGSMSHANIRYAQWGMWLDGSSPTLDNVTISDASRVAISALPTDAPTITNFSASNSVLNGLQIRNGTVDVATTWSNTGIAYILQGDVTVAAAATLTIGPGVLVKMGGSGTQLLVDGTLNVNGTSGNPVTFTSLADDTLSGDTNNDGDTTAPAAGDWSNIGFRAGSSGSMSHANIRYAQWGMWLDGSSPTIANVTISDASRMAISALPTDAPTITNFSASNSVLNGLQIRSGAVDVATTWSNTGIAYILQGDVTVAADATLTIGPGVLVKSSGSGTSLLVNGTLNVNGSEAEPVIFTSLADDTLGGDTNNDGDDTSPAAGNWESIAFFAGSSGSVNHANIRYAGGSAAIYLQGSSPIVNSTVISASASSAISALPTDMPTLTDITIADTPRGGLEIRSGSVDADTTWSNITVPYILPGDVAIATDAALTIGPGALVKSSGSSTELRVNGTLNISGTTSAPVILTSLADDTVGGDTNNDGDATAPAAGDWSGITFLAGSGGRISYANMRYTGWSIWLEDSSPTLDNVTISDASRVAISALPTDTPTITNFSASNSVLNGLQIRNGTVDAATTWSNTGIAYILQGDVTVAAAATLTIGPGVLVKSSGSGTSLLVNGTLDINGTTSAPVIFTSLADDTLGGDTNNDGDDTSPAAGNWESIAFFAGSSGSVSHADIRYAGGGAAIWLDGSSPSIDNVRISDASRSAISMLPSDNPTIANVTMSNTARNGLEIRQGTIDGTMVWDNTELVYILGGDVTVADGARLDIQGGVIVKAVSGADILVNGTLNVNGAPDNWVYFTSIKDDFVGGDTNNDGSASVPEASNWGAIQFLEGSNGTLDGIDVRYGGSGAIYARNSAPIISNCVLRNNRIGLLSDGDAARVNISRCDIYDNTGNGVQNNSTVEDAIVNATFNWWGHRAGPYDPSDADGRTNNNRRGQPISNYVNYDSWSPERTQVTLLVSSNVFRFEGTTGGNTPGDEILSILAEGPDSELPIPWTAQEDIPWLSLSQTSGQTPADVDLSIVVNTAELTPDVYEGQIVVDSPDAKLSPQIIDVELRMVTDTVATPVLDVEPTRLLFAAREGSSNPRPQQLVVDNSGTGSLNWTAEEVIPWLELDRTSGTSQNIINTSVDITGLREDIYTGAITITNQSDPGNPIVVDVSLAIGCETDQAVDVMLVLDRSGSMSGGKLDSAKAAAIDFLNQMNLNVDQVGVVSFAGSAVLDIELSQEGTMVEDTIDNLSLSGSTNIPDALRKAGEELASVRRRPDNTPVIVLLTDGQSNAGGDPVAIAQELKDDGIEIYTIGLGSDADANTLATIASTPDGYFASPTPEDLAEIYSRVAVTVGCPVIANSGTIYLPLIAR